VSPEYFDTLGVTPSAGHLFSPETELIGADPVVVVSHRFWRVHLAANPNVVGQRLFLNGHPTTIVGVASAGFLGIWPGNPADLFIPVTCSVNLAPELGGDPLHDSAREIFRLVLRLAPGITPAIAETAMNVQMRELDRQRGIHDEHDRVLRLIPAGSKLSISPEQRAFVDTFNAVLWGLVLVLVCANVSGLLLARGIERRKEIAVRISLGAGRMRLMRQFITESVLLAMAGALTGLALAWGITQILASIPVPSSTPLEFFMRPDLHVLGVTIGVALIVGIGLGLVPALHSTHLEISLTLKEGEHAASHRYHILGTRNLFVLGQMAASLMLLVITWYAVTDFLHGFRQNPGFVTTNLHLFSLDPVRDGHPAAEVPELFSRIRKELASLPDVQNVTVTGSVPFASMGSGSTAYVSSGVGDAIYSVDSCRIGTRYFATTGIPLMAGREFDPRDEEKTENDLPVILNQTAALQLFGNKNPIGRIVRDEKRTYTVVGLTRDVRSNFLNKKASATIFVPMTMEWFLQNPAENLTFLIRGTVNARKALASLHPDLSVFNVRTLNEDLSRMNAVFDWFASIFACLGLFALLLACLGLGGVTSYAVSSRQREIGIRMALGARRYQILSLILREGVALTVAGSLIGIAGVFTLARLFASFSDVLARTFGQRSSYSLLLLCAPLLLSAVALLACYIPAHRSTSIDPVAALRE
jgi:predicted permease